MLRVSGANEGIDRGRHDLALGALVLASSVRSVLLVAIVLVVVLVVIIFVVFVVVIVLAFWVVVVLVDDAHSSLACRLSAKELGAVRCGFWPVPSGEHLHGVGLEVAVLARDHGLLGPRPEDVPVLGRVVHVLLVGMFGVTLLAVASEFARVLLVVVVEAHRVAIVMAHTTRYSELVARIAIDVLVVANPLLAYIYIIYSTKSI